MKVTKSVSVEWSVEQSAASHIHMRAHTYGAWINEYMTYGIGDSPSEQLQLLAHYREIGVTKKADPEDAARGLHIVDMEIDGCKPYSDRLGNAMAMYFGPMGEDLPVETQFIQLIWVEHDSVIKHASLLTHVAICSGRRKFGEIRPRFRNTRYPRVAEWREQRIASDTALLASVREHFTDLLK